MTASVGSRQRAPPTPEPWLREKNWSPEPALGGHAHWVSSGCGGCPGQDPSAYLRALQPMPSICCLVGGLVPCSPSLSTPLWCRQEWTQDQQTVSRPSWGQR